LAKYGVQDDHDPSEIARGRSVNLRDHIGKRGESIFTVLITRWCDGHPWFRDAFLGEKHETTDFMIELIEPTAGHAQFYVQVRSTNARYTGRGNSRKLNVSVGKKDIDKLKQIHAPTYVVGIDIDRACGYIVAVTKTAARGIYGIPVRNSLNCRTLKALWKEVDDYWKAKDVLAHESRFAD
jgi:hypothetical protein